MNTINYGGKFMDLTIPRVMGIINTTPDSFFSGSRSEVVQDSIAAAAMMISEGVDIVDIGGVSTRPGADPVTVEEELDRVIPVIEGIRARFPEVCISIDTFHSVVAEKAVLSGANIINDVSAGAFDREIMDVAAAYDVPYVLMHMRGTPETMQKMTEYEDVVAEVFDFLAGKLEVLRSKGVKDVVIDPGLGFAKKMEHNYRILREMAMFSILGCPILIGLSRKAMLWRLLDITPEEALNATTAMNMVALIQGAAILRVHDVREAKQTITLYRQWANA